MPVAGAIVWTLIGIAGLTLSPVPAVLVVFIGTGSIFFLGLLLSRFFGEDLLGKTRPKNSFDVLYLYTLVMSLLVFSIAIPFFRADYTSLPLTVGILLGLMWLPLSWIIGHWVGLFHALSRTLLVVVAWYLFPDARFVAIPAVIVVIYIITIAILEQRWRRIASAG